MSDPTLDGPSTPPAAGGPPKHLVVLLHGYGADGADLIGLAPAFARFLPHAAFHSPHAPFACEMSPMGRQWFSLANYDPALVRASKEAFASLKATMTEGTRVAAPILNGYIDGLLAQYGLTDDKLILIGFSQGTMMALNVALQRKAPCGGVVGFSGALLEPDTVTAHPSVLLIHGDADDVVPVQALDNAKTGLQALNVPVETHVCRGLSHGIDDEGAMLAAHFMTDKLND